MKRYLITSPRFAGQAEIIYTEDGRLANVSLIDTDMDAATARAFIVCVSGHEGDVAARFSEDTKIMESEVLITFEMFWKAYGKKIAKKRAEALWDKLDKSTQAAAYVGIRKYNKYLVANKWRSKCDPDTYLRGAYWENEYE